MSGRWKDAAIGLIIAVLVMALAIIPAQKEAVEIADERCKQKYSDQYKGLASAGQIYCILENDSYMPIPQKEVLEQ